MRYLVPSTSRQLSDWIKAVRGRRPMGSGGLVLEVVGSCQQHPLLIQPGSLETGSSNHCCSPVQALSECTPLSAVSSKIK